MLGYVRNPVEIFIGMWSSWGRTDTFTMFVFSSVNMDNFPFVQERFVVFPKILAHFCYIYIAKCLYGFVALVNGIFLIAFSSCYY